MATFNTRQYVESGFSNIGTSEADIRAAITAINSDYSNNGYLGALGGARPQMWAEQASRALNNTSGDTSQNLNTARDWLTGARQASGAASELAAYRSRTADVQNSLANIIDNVRNTLDFSAPGTQDNTDQNRSRSIANVNTSLNNNAGILNTAQILGIDLPADFVRSGDTWTVTSGVSSTPYSSPTGTQLTAAQTAARDRQLAIEANAGVTPSSTNTAATNAFQPTSYSDSAQLSELQRSVMGADSNAAANRDFINGAFQAFHNRDATAAELAAYEGKPVSGVRTEIVGGAQAAGLPTVAQGTVDIPTGVLTSAQATEQGLQRVLRPDQLSAFREDQIVRDNQGGIYLRQDTTTQAQRDAVQSGTSGSQIASVQPSVVGSPTASAQDLSTASTAPDASSYLDVFSNNSGASAADLSSAIVASSTSFLDSIIGSYNSRIAEIEAKINAEKADVNSITGRITAMTTATPNADALAAASEAEGLREKQAKLSEIKTQIIAEQERLNLGLINESNKMAPLSIIGQRQATLQAQGLARIGALSAIAQVYQDDLNFAKDMVNATVTAMNADRAEQLHALDTLLTLHQNEIIKLSDEENAMVTARQSAINSAMDRAQKDADLVFDLIKANPDAALQGKVSLSDSSAVALSKMAPFMAEAERAKAASDAAKNTQVIDLGNRKVLIDTTTGEEIRSYTESQTPGSNYKDTTRADGSVIRTYTDDTGRPTGEVITLVTADDAKKITEFKTAVNDYITKMGEEDSTTTWQSARTQLHIDYPELDQNTIDSWLAGHVTIYSSPTGGLTEVLRQYPNLQREVDYWRTQKNANGNKYSDNEILNLFEEKYKPNFSNDLSTSQNGSTDKIVSVTLGTKSVQVSSAISSNLAKADADYYAATGKHIVVSEGLRSTERQASLYARYQSGQGGRAAPPGQSFHETGKAIDVSGDWKAAEPYLRKYGFRNDLPDDRHHFSIGEFS